MQSENADFDQLPRIGSRLAESQGLMFSMSAQNTHLISYYNRRDRGSIPVRQHPMTPGPAKAGHSRDCGPTGSRSIITPIMTLDGETRKYLRAIRPDGTSLELDPEEESFFEAETGIHDAEELRKHIIEADEETYRVSRRSHAAWVH